MNLKQFKEEVAALPEELDDIEVFHLRDPEGNGFNYTAGISVEYYLPGDDVPTSLEYIKEAWDEDYDGPFDEEEVLKEYQKVALVW